MTQTQEIDGGSSAPAPGKGHRTPRLSAEGKAALDALLAKAVAGRTVPALHFAATTKDGVLYAGQAGERVFGEPDKGQVNAETSESCAALCCAVLCGRGRAHVRRTP